MKAADIQARRPKEETNATRQEGAQTPATTRTGMSTDANPDANPAAHDRARADVFVNGRSVIHAGCEGKALATMPDPCWCSPHTPVGPTLLPLANHAFARDLQHGAASVRVQGHPVAMANSFIARSTGNAAASSNGGGLAHGGTLGSAHFASHASSVLIEGQGVPRHLDWLTQNHGSSAAGSLANTPPGVWLGRTAPPSSDDHAGTALDNAAASEGPRSAQPQRRWQATLHTHGLGEGRSLTGQQLILQRGQDGQDLLCVLQASTWMQATIEDAGSEQASPQLLCLDLMAMASLL